MATSFSPSINIVRDHAEDIRYIPTANSRRLFDLIVNNFQQGIHAFNIIGSYGTGKSAFLLAFERHLTGQKQIFAPLNGYFSDYQEFDFLHIIGEKSSFKEAIADAFAINQEAPTKKVLQGVDTYCREAQKEKRCVVLVVDEFGKFLEYAASVDPDKELYFVQQLSELANNKEQNLLFLTTLHQNFDAYAVGLLDAQRKEWEKVKGRLKELTFNEPAEQLLHLASEFIADLDLDHPHKQDTTLISLVKKKKPFRLATDIKKDFAKSLFPFDVLSGIALTLALQRYGQNERSLFNFLQADDHLGLSSFSPDQESPYFNLACVYDYLIYNYYPTLTSKYNPDFFQWSQLRNALDRVESILTENIPEALNLVKSIGLLNILGSSGGQIDGELLAHYGKQYLGAKDISYIIEQLEEAQIIRYQSFKHRYKLFAGTDTNIDKLLADAKNEVGGIGSLSTELASYVQNSFIPAKAVTYERGTPRIFALKLTDAPVDNFYFQDKNEIDGLINIIFSNDVSLPNSDNLPIVYGVINQLESLKDSVLDIKAVEKALDLVGYDDVARQELVELKFNQIQRLNQVLNHELFYSDHVSWFFAGEEKPIKSPRHFNQLLSQVMTQLYAATPVFRNELMNKTKVSSSIHTAKKNFIHALIDSWNRPNLDFDEQKFPAEKTIYLALLQDTGLHQKLSAVSADFSDKPTNSSFQELWNASLQFLEDAKVSKRKLSEFIERLRRPPFGLKDGFIEFWLISFLFIKREDYALFEQNRYIPFITKEVAELFFREAQNYSVKSFNIEGVKLDLFNKYRELTQQSSEQKLTSSGFQATAKPFLVFYRQLPEYTKKTKNVSHDALAFRDVLQQAKELEKTFFEDLPTRFGYTMEGLSSSKDALEGYVHRIQSCIAELRTAEDQLFARIEQLLHKIFGQKRQDIERLRTKIRKRYHDVKDHLLNSRQKSFYTRLYSELPDHKAWLNSLAQAIVGKPVRKFSDLDEKVLSDRLRTAFKELDDLLDLSQENFDEENETVFKVEISSFDDDPIKKNIILSGEHLSAVNEIEEKVQKLFKGKDPKVIQAALLKLLKDKI